MSITLPKPRSAPINAEEFIGAAPDSLVAPGAKGVEAGPKTLKAKRGKSRSQVSVVLADELIARIDECAAKIFMSRSAYITLALNKLLKDGAH